ncbi:hypothetical protein DB30_01111 [Enhygromyxa salina]|uniref:Uncharacterized protein n=1 Tax=Enhygromyxa salina TaxID=215803 RepID=A0A0C1ZNZ3_9BACT|nr:hypothetical protein [Enhygromyxa salina]KIG12753.1 hypothetical protein DB30_01111 [Enhygromyxa salina]
MEAESKTDAEIERRAKRRRLGLVIRGLIYVPLLGFFGWQAANTFIAGRRGADDNFRAFVQTSLHAMPAPRTIKLPNGEEMPVFEVTEAQAVEMGLLPEANDAQAE